MFPILSIFSKHKIVSLVLAMIKWLVSCHCEARSAKAIPKMGYICYKVTKVERIQSVCPQSTFIINYLRLENKLSCQFFKKRRYSAGFPWAYSDFPSLKFIFKGAAQNGNHTRYNKLFMADSFCYP